MENKNSNKGLIVLVIFLIIIVLGLSSYIVYDKFIKPNSTKETTEKETVSLKKDSTKPLVYDDGKYKYCKVPIININSTDADKLNKDIEDYVDKMGENGYGEYYNLDYDFFENNDILSVKIIIRTEGSSRYYHTSNINIKTGKKVTNSELLKLKNIKEEDLSDKLFKVYEKDLENNDSLEDAKRLHKYDDEFTSIYDGTKNIIESNKVDDFDMYLNSKGELCVITRVYLIAGPETNFYSFNLDTNLREKESR